MQYAVYNLNPKPLTEVIESNRENAICISCFNELKKYSLVEQSLAKKAVKALEVMEIFNPGS